MNQTAAPIPMAIVYRARNLVNGKSYIGYTGRGLQQREKQHRAIARQGRGHFFHAAIRKHGGENFVFEVMGDFGDDADLAKAYECEAIAAYKPEYNISMGGDGNWVADETRKKIGDANRGKTPSAATRQKQSEAHRGKKLSATQRLKIGAANKGRKVSEETRRRMSGRTLSAAHKAVLRAVNTGKRLSEATREKLRAINLGKTISEETRRKIRAANKGRPAHNKGTSVSADTKAKMRAAQLGKVRTEEARANMRAAQVVNRKPVKCTTDGRIFASSREAELFYGLCQAAVTRVVTGRIKSTRGLHFVRYEGEL